MTEALMLLSLVGQNGQASANRGDYHCKVLAAIQPNESLNEELEYLQLQRRTAIDRVGYPRLIVLTDEGEYYIIKPGAFYPSGPRAPVENMTVASPKNLRKPVLERVASGMVGGK
jgi:hypothetical protein